MKVKYIGKTPERHYKDLETGREFTWKQGDVKTMPKEIGSKLIESQPDIFTEKNGGEE